MALYLTKTSSELAYTSCPYSEVLALRPAVSYIIYTKSSYEQTGDVIYFAQFEEGGLLENEHSLEQVESISASNDNSYSDGGYSGWKLLTSKY